MAINRNYFFNSEKIHFVILPQTTEELFQKYTNSNIMTTTIYLVFTMCQVLYIIYIILFFSLYMRRKLRFREIK